MRARSAEALGYVALEHPDAVDDPEILADFRIGLSFDDSAFDVNPDAAEVCNTPLAIDDEVFEDLRAFIYDETGIYFRDNKRYLLESQVGRRLAVLGLGDYESYLRMLHNGGRRRELPQLVNSVTINETFFFRHPPHYEALEETLVPEALARRTAFAPRTVRIWSAGCSTGDEPYTIAMVVREKLQPRYPDVRFEILGTDINTEVLARARAGLFSAYAVRNVPPSYARTYFEQEADGYRLAPEIREMVSFRQMNLTDPPAMQRMRRFDVIFCANVLIYFDGPTKERVVGAFHESLNDGGTLVVGVSETLFGVEQTFASRRLEKIMVYQKEA